MSRVTVHSVAKAMYEAGIITEWQYNNTGRIVIVLDAKELPVMYFESWLDEKFVTVVVPELKGVEVIVKGPDPGDGKGSSGEPEELSEGSAQEPDGRDEKEHGREGASDAGQPPIAPG